MHNIDQVTNIICHNSIIPSLITTSLDNTLTLKTITIKIVEYLIKLRSVHINDGEKLINAS